MKRQRLFTKVILLILVLISSTSWAERNYTHILTLGMSPSDPNYDPNTNYNTLKDALQAMRELEPPLAENVLGCIKIYPGTYYHNGGPSFPPDDMNKLDTHCDLKGMGPTRDSVLIIHPSEGTTYNHFVIVGSGDNYISNVKIYNYLTARNGVCLKGNGNIDNCHIETIHGSLTAEGDLTIKNSYVKGMGCVGVSGIIDMSDCEIVPWAPVADLEVITGIAASSSGVVKDVTISCEGRSSYNYEGSGIFGFLLRLPSNKSITISNVDINLQLTSRYNSSQTAALRVCGIMSGSNWSSPGSYPGTAIVRNCTMSIVGIEEDTNPDGAGIMVDGICVRAGGKIEIWDSNITTDRTKGDNAEDGYEYLLNNENGTIRVDFNSVNFDPNGPDEPNCYDVNYVNGEILDWRVENKTQGTKYFYIQDALDDANNGDIIEALPSLYYESICFNGVACTVRSTDPNDSAVVASTVIDGSGHEHAVQFCFGEDSNSLIEGFTITGAGRGIGCYNNSEPVVQKCVIKGNDIGVYIDSSSPSVKNNLIYGNSQGITFSAGAALIRNNTIADNIGAGIKNMEQSLKISWSTDMHSGEGPYTSGGEQYYSLQGPLKIQLMMNEVKDNLDFFVHTGDFTSHEICWAPWNCYGQTSEENLRLALEALDGYGITRHLVTGNHDISRTNKNYTGCTDFEPTYPDPDYTQKEAWMNIVGEDGPAYVYNIVDNGKRRGYYSFSIKGYHFVMLDFNYFADGNDHTGIPYISGDWNYPQHERDWLESDLAAHSQETTFVFTHWAGGGYWSTVRSILEAAGNVEAVFSGHIHYDTYSEINGIRYYCLDNVATKNVDPNLEWPAGSGIYGNQNYNTYATIEVNEADIFTLTGYGPSYAYDAWDGNTVFSLGEINLTEPVITNCIIWNNGDDLIDCNATYSCISDGDGGLGNIDDEPNFINTGNKNYHIQPYSPCGDAGDPNVTAEGETDIDGDPRRMNLDGGSDANSIIDIGADEIFGKIFNVTKGKGYLTIQEAINAASNGDIIEISTGEYTENIKFNGKAITLQSTDPDNWDIIADTTILGTITFDQNEDNSSVLKGLRIDARIIPLNCVYCVNSSPQIANCILEGNRYGVKCVNSSAKTYNCKITDNTWGIYASGSLAPQIKSCLIYNNTTGIQVSSCSSTTEITNNTIVNCTNGIYSINSDTLIRNCIIWDCKDALINCSATYSCIDDVNDANGTGNITDDPCFVNADANSHLGPYSPCINAGKPNEDYTGQTDIDGDARVMYGLVDMGADEAYPIAGDFEPDEDVDVADLGTFAEHWIDDGCSDPDWCGNCDINRSGLVDFADFARFAEHWLAGVAP